MSKRKGTRYSEKDLLMFKKIIEKKLEKTQAELKYMRNQILELNEKQQRGDWVDDSSSHAEGEMLNNMVARQIQFVRNLQNALIRIENKTYGVCSVTGNLIDKERLKLVPHATKTISGKNTEAAKKQQRRFGSVYNRK